MVGKVLKSAAPFQCADYCLNHDSAEIIGWDGLDIDSTDAAHLSATSGREREQLAREMAWAIDTSFSVQAALNPAVEKPVGHIPLCFMKADAPLLDNAMMARIAREYLEMMGYGDTQYMLVRHYNAKGNPHVHIFFNRVGNDGRCLNAWQDYRRNAVVCLALTEKYGLHLSDGRRNTIVDDLHGRERVRYQISNAIDAALPRCHDLTALGRTLSLQGISMEIHRRTGGTIQGLSFSRTDDRNPSVLYTFRGSEVGRRYSYAHIMEKLGRSEDTHMVIRREDLAPQAPLHETHASRSSLTDELIGVTLSATSGIPSRERDIDAEEAKRKRRKKSNSPKL